ncbi:MAG: succinyl-diaminopimelate desuccinylase [Myxococcaceae bacterium]
MSVELAARALKLCEILSPIGQEKALADELERWARGPFQPAEIFRLSHSLLLGRLDDPRPTVALIGHVDTVPAHPEDGPPRIEGDRLHGLGSSDMKGGLAVMMALAEKLDRKTLPFNVVFILYEREEGPYVESGLGPLFQAKPELKNVKLGIALEPTDNTIQVGCVGSLQATLRFVGQSAHSARPWQGKNAIHLAGPLLSELLARERVEVRFGEFSFYEVMSATLASGGRAKNVVPDKLELNLNYRFAPGKSVEQAQEDVRAFVKGRAEIDFLDGAPSGRVCADNALYQQFVARTQLPTASKQAWTDVARLAAFGVDAVKFGPGETAQAHQKNESASVAALAVAYEKLARFLMSAE